MLGVERKVSSVPELNEKVNLRLGETTLSVFFASQRLKQIGNERSTC